jgi:hypothetical protein
MSAVAAHANVQRSKQRSTSNQVCKYSTALYLVENCVVANDGKRDAGLLRGAVELKTSDPGGQPPGGLSWSHRDLRGRHAGEHGSLVICQHFSIYASKRQQQLQPHHILLQQQIC